MTASRPQSRGGRESHPGSVRALSSRGGARSGLGDGYGGGRPRSEFGGGMPSLDVKMRRAADVYLAAPAPGGLRGRHPSRHASPRARGLPSLTEDRHSWTGGGIGSRDELEAALAQAQTALVMAKERISMLEQQNAALRANAAKVGGGGGGGGGVMGGGGGQRRSCRRPRSYSARRSFRRMTLRPSRLSTCRIRWAWRERRTGRGRELHNRHPLVEAVQRVAVIEWRSGGGMSHMASVECELTRGVNGGNEALHATVCAWKLIHTFRDEAKTQKEEERGSATGARWTCEAPARLSVCVQMKRRWKNPA